MARSKRPTSPRMRVGRVSLYQHHGAWWIYYRDAGRPVRRKAAEDRNAAEQVAAQINAQLTSGAPTLLAFTPITVPDLRKEFLDFHEQVLGSSISTVRRYRAATQHLEDHVAKQLRPLQAHEVKADTFATYLRKVEVAPNGHVNTQKRKLHGKGIRFILETCRSLYGFALKRRHLPPYTENPFSVLPLDRLKADDAKPIFVFTAATELSFLRSADAWSFPIHFTLAKTGLRVGELVHLLIEDIDLDTGWLHVRNKTAIGWRVKTGAERTVPILSEVSSVLRWVIADRKAGPVFLRKRFADSLPELQCNCREMERVCQDRRKAAGQDLPRSDVQRIACDVWRDAGAIKSDAVRISYIRIMAAIGQAEATCPKSWRHSFATLLQDANVDPLIRQQTLGHRPTTSTGLGMTGNYTHTRRETQKAQIERALRTWPDSLDLALRFVERTKRRASTGT